jgi:hypothetical protein
MFSDDALREIVDSIPTSTGCLLEIMNYNIDVRYFYMVAFSTNVPFYRVNNMSVREHLWRFKQ